jgi:hypothetical protein
MANIIPDAFKLELLSGTHNFASGGNTFYIALYVTTLGPPYTTSSTVYSATNEVSSSGTGYATGGQALDSQAVSVPGSNTAVVDFANEVFSTVTLTSLGAAIYNSTNGNKLCLVIDFGGDKVATAGDFTIQFPAVGATTAIIRVA